MKLVGASRFELLTPGPPCQCATRLRHAPILTCRDSSARRAAMADPPAPPMRDVPLRHRRTPRTERSNSPKTRVKLHPSVRSVKPRNPESANGCAPVPPADPEPLKWGGLINCRFEKGPSRRAGTGYPPGMRWAPRIPRRFQPSPCNRARRVWGEPAPYWQTCVVVGGTHSWRNVVIPPGSVYHGTWR